MNFNKLKVGQMLEHFMDNRHYFIITGKKGDNLKFLQFSISDREFRFGYRSTTRKIWNGPNNVFARLNLANFSHNSKVIIMELFEGDKVSELLKQYF